ncbi:MAG: plasmid maintenance protein CcdB [Burkholderiales bacterium]|nr:MAG: plasmid maintenance protein CcdB [Burkholderiales bacterium]
MARFDVYPNPDATERKLIPFFLDVQNDHIDGLQTRMVVPLWKAQMLPLRARGLNPEFDVADQTVVMDTPSMGAVPISVLRGAVANMTAQQLDIFEALDALFGSH